MKILIFTEGTAIMHSTAQGVSREERVKQSAEESESVKSFRTYIPNGLVVEKMNHWKSQGAEIYYLTSRTTSQEINDIRKVLTKYEFPDHQNLLYRKEDQQYKDVAEKLVPDVFIEDDCESIGGEVEMTFPHISKEYKSKIKSIIVPEFAGIDHLPNNLEDLLKTN